MKEDQYVSVPCTVVGVNDVRSFQKDGQDIKFASIHVRVGTTLMKLKVSPDNTSFLSQVAKLLDKKVVVDCELFAGQGMTASIRAVGVQAVK